MNESLQLILIIVEMSSSISRRECVGYHATFTVENRCTQWLILRSRMSRFPKTIRKQNKRMKTNGNKM